jgi:hypothetical protein
VCYKFLFFVLVKNVIGNTSFEQDVAEHVFGPLVRGFPKPLVWHIRSFYISEQCAIVRLMVGFEEERYALLLPSYRKDHSEKGSGKES